MNIKKVSTQKMNATRGLREWREINSLFHLFPRPQNQLNAPYESDCEILRFGSRYWCFSTDSIGEEIDLKIYQNPELWGWMTVMSSVSDLAASGSTGLGVLLSNQCKYKTTATVKRKFLKGARAALLKSQIPLLGGDTGSGSSHCHSSTIVGTSRTRPLTRLGIKPGDWICLVGKKQTGLGPSIALGLLFDLPRFPEKYFSPQPSPRVIQKLRPYLKASIDTSDGIATSLNILRALNEVGFQLYWREETLHPQALKYCRRHKIHPLLLWLNDLGDLQTLVVVSPTQLMKLPPDCVPIARAVPLKEGVSVYFQNQKLRLNLDEITNAPRRFSDLKKLYKKLNRFYLKATRSNDFTPN